MTNPQSEDLVRRLRAVAEFGGTHLDGLWTEAADLIEQLEREKDDLVEEAAYWREEVAAGLHAEADTLARYIELRGMTVNTVPVLTPEEIQAATTIAKRRVNGE